MLYAHRKKTALFFCGTIFLAVIFFAFFSKNKNKAEEITVVIPEGKTVKEINYILRQADVLSEQEEFKNSDESLEGYLFPDTYIFYKNSSLTAVKKKFLENFQKKAEPLLVNDQKNFKRNLVLASIIEKEIPDFEDRKIVAGILLKRLSINMPLQVDSTLCYIKNLENTSIDLNEKSCYPILNKDKESVSPFNTYRYKGLPPAPISNPGEDSITAVLNAKESPFLFYLSHPTSGKTVFSKTLEEHNANKAKYLSG